MLFTTGVGNWSASARTYLVSVTKDVGKGESPLDLRESPLDLLSGRNGHKARHEKHENSNGKMVQSSETHDDACKSPPRSGSSAVLLLKLRVSVTAVTNSNWEEKTISKSKAAGDSAGPPHFFLESSRAPNKGEHVKTPTLNSVAEAWDPRVQASHGPATRACSNGVVFAPAQRNALSAGEMPTRASSLLA
jgi:hypothetical protein